MTTQRDLEFASDAPSLTICDQCGWYSVVHHAERCDPVRGLAARQLIEAIPSVRSGQLGYGEGKVIFEIAEDLVVVLESNQRERSFSLCDVEISEALSASESASLVRAIQEWHREVEARKTESRNGM